ncbi:MAG: nicotinamide mononucleotide transporter [Clostridia bacterium]|nr:nicotinamide mononucleotide transporter [Clostridia bacterium]
MKEKIRKVIKYFRWYELALWATSITLILVSFFLFDRVQYLTLTASLIGTTSLTFNAKGNPIGQVLIIIFGLIYGYISFGCAYYGEMFTYVGMSVPMAVLALISWLRNPFAGKRSEVRINRIRPRELPIMAFLTVGVTVGFFFILRALGTANLLISTVSVTTSFAAVYLTFRRSPFFALAYAFNDIVLIVLWSIASVNVTDYLSVIICFATFLVNDLYTFINWLRIERRQRGPLR